MSESVEYETEGELDADGNWVNTGDGSGSADASSSFSYGVITGHYSRDIPGGTIDGSITGFNLDAYSSHTEWESSLGENGNWNVVSGTATISESNGEGTGYSGTGNYILSGSTTGSDGTTTDWSFSGTFQEGGSEDSTEGDYENQTVVDGQWVVTGGGASASGGNTAWFSDNGAGTYSQTTGAGTISGSYSRGTSGSTSFRATISEVPDVESASTGEGWTTISASASANASGGSNFSYNGGGTLTYGMISGTYTEAGSGSVTFSSALNFAQDADGEWTPTAGNQSTTTSTGSLASYSGAGSGTDSGANSTLAWNN